MCKIMWNCKITIIHVQNYVQNYIINVHAKFCPKLCSKFCAELCGIILQLHHITIPHTSVKLNTIAQFSKNLVFENWFIRFKILSTFYYLWTLLNFKEKIRNILKILMYYKFILQSFYNRFTIVFTVIYHIFVEWIFVGDFLRRTSTWRCSEKVHHRWWHSCERILSLFWHFLRYRFFVDRFYFVFERNLPSTVISLWF